MNIRIVSGVKNDEDINTAIDHLEKILPQISNNVEALTVLEIIYFSAGMYLQQYKILFSLTLIEETDANLVECRITRCEHARNQLIHNADNFIQQKEFEEGISILDFIEQVSPGHVTALRKKSLQDYCNKIDAEIDKKNYTAVAPSGCVETEISASKITDFKLRIRKAYAATRLNKASFHTSNISYIKEHILPILLKPNGVIELDLSVNTICYRFFRSLFAFAHQSNLKKTYLANKNTDALTITVNTKITHALAHELVDYSVNERDIKSLIIHKLFLQETPCENLTVTKIAGDKASIVFPMPLLKASGMMYEDTGTLRNRPNHRDVIPLGNSLSSNYMSLSNR